MTRKIYGVEAKIVEYVTDPGTVGIHMQDRNGVCLSLGSQPWVHLSHECIQHLRTVLNTVLPPLDGEKRCSST